MGALATIGVFVIIINVVAFIYRALLELVPPSSLSEVKNGYEYERYCAGRLEDEGWSCTVTQASGDQGVDVIARKNRIKVAIQCKFYKHSAVGNKAVQEVIAGAIYSGSSYKAVIAPSGYTSGAAELAKAANVLLIGPDDIPRLEWMIVQCQVDNFISGLRE